MGRRIAILLTVLATVLAVRTSLADEMVATLTLDGMSFVSFEDREVLPLPSGSTLRFRFGEPSGSRVPFTIAPGDVRIAPIDIGDGRSLVYGLGKPASGTLRVSNGETILEFTGTVTATLTGDARGMGTFTYVMPFTTETASATSRRGRRVEAKGERLVGGAGYTQLVGATVNRTNAFPEPGAAVYTVLSGTFDRLPTLGE